MSNRRDPFNEEFDIEDKEFDDVYDEIVIPEEPELRHISDFALSAYKSIMDNIGLFSPESRMKMYEIAQKYLSESKDALHKIERLKFDKMKLKMSQKGKAEKTTTATDKGQEDDNSGGFSIEELQRIADEEHKKKRANG